MSKGNWTRDEHIVAFNLYCKIPFTKINENYAPIKELAKILGRTNGSVAMKLANFARLDPALKAKNISGLTRGAKGEEEVWNEFNGNWEELSWESELILAKYKHESIEESTGVNTEDIFVEGKERKSLIKIRVNQNFFRKTILSSYNNCCCISGITVPGLLVASHIVPWSIDKDNRINPTNGICLNALHDKAFDNGLITIDSNYKIVISEELKMTKGIFVEEYFLKFDSKPIDLPSKFLPNIDFLNYHSQNIFKG